MSGGAKRRCDRTPRRFAWETGGFHSRPDLPWPPRGVRLNATFAAPRASPNRLLQAHVIYELYDAIPVFSKWIEFTNPSESGIETEITSVAVEMLRVPEHMAPSPGAGTRLMVETDYMPRHTYWTNYNCGPTTNAPHADLRGSSLTQLDAVRRPEQGHDHRTGVDL